MLRQTRRDRENLFALSEIRLKRRLFLLCARHKGAKVLFVFTGVYCINTNETLQGCLVEFSAQTSLESGKPEKTAHLWLTAKAANARGIAEPLDCARNKTAHLSTGSEDAHFGPYRQEKRARFSLAVPG